MEELIGSASAPQTDLIKDTNQQDFAKDVMEASMTQPVLVDFWAPWCGPCKQMMPAIEQAVIAAKGAVKLVKVNIDENQMLASQLRVQSVPMVYAFFQGQPVDGFNGALPPSEITKFIDTVIKKTGGVKSDPLADALEQAAMARENQDDMAAMSIYSQILEHVPDNEPALIGMLECQISANMEEEAQALFDQVPDDIKTKPEFSAIVTKLELAGQSLGNEEIVALKNKVEKDQTDNQSRFDLALALQAEGSHEEAADHLLYIIKHDREWNDDAARIQLLKFFEAWGMMDPMTMKARGKLSSLLFS
ncbi:co-chaperone YbbN [Kiloniella sp. EL199]|uniref:thioredoxin family protein n=1 Tax=Kiloniella sp. EL199 TaxID=2107581 RepID=UPI000EA16EF7|nr:co-chaperone YbbN [Kiloniella sp. EL199]